MATITSTAMSGSGSRVVTETTCTASDTFTFNDGDILILKNDTAGALTPNIVGDGATTVGVPGVGNVDVSGGYDLPSVAGGTAVAIPLSSISKYLTGTITMTGADGMVAQLLAV
jgi:hypothetical protein